MEQNQIEHENDQILQKLLEALISISLTFISVAWIFNISNRKWVVGFLTILVGILFLLLYGKTISKINYFIGAYILLLDIWGYYVITSTFSLSQNFFWVILALAIGLLLQMRKIRPYTVLIPFLITTGIIIFNILLGFESVNDSSFYFMNRNTLTKIILSYGALYSIIRAHQFSPKPIIWPAILILIVGYLSNSRGGLLIALLYILLQFFSLVTYNKNNSNIQFFQHKKRKIAAIIIFIVLILIGYVMISNSRFMTRGFSSSGRIEIYKIFFSELTLQKFITGFRPSALDTYAHMHNSFIQLFMSTGVLSFPIFVVLILTGIKLKGISISLFLLFGIMCLYSMEGIFLLYGLGDFVLIPLIYLTFSHKKDQNEQIDTDYH